jgi:hypothetical protein
LLFLFGWDVEISHDGDLSKALSRLQHHVHPPHKPRTANDLRLPSDSLQHHPLAASAVAKRRSTSSRATAIPQIASSTLRTTSEISPLEMSAI